MTKLEKHQIKKFVKSKPEWFQKIMAYKPKTRPKIVMANGTNKDTIANKV